MSVLTVSLCPILLFSDSVDNRHGAIIFCLFILTVHVDIENIEIQFYALIFNGTFKKGNVKYIFTLFFH